ncbi:MAG TPA: hypothetical protein VK822_33215 [Acetobacteraceae bacterium]|nr:hypothetical protein [Acetobacteraceae bacterium]
MQDDTHQVGLKIVGEMLPQERRSVTLAGEQDQYGLPIARVEYTWCDNDRALNDHSLRFMTLALRAIDATDIWEQRDDTCHMNGMARMGDDRMSLGSPNDLFKIVRQQRLVVGKAPRRVVESGFDRGIRGICHQNPNQGMSSWFCNSLTLPTCRLRVRFWTNRVVTPNRGRTPGGRRD